MSKLAASISAIALSLVVLATPAAAASPMSEAFLANVSANLTILDASSRLAQDHSGSAALKRYAASETGETKEVAVALTEALPSVPHLAIIAEPLRTGRSVAVVGMPGRALAPTAPVLEAANTRMPATADLAPLKALHGEAFDRAFFILQLDALSQIESDYRLYIEQGDDPALVALADAELPGLMRRLGALAGV